MASSSMRFSHPAQWPEVLHPADFGGYHSGRWFPSIRSSKSMFASKETFVCFWNLHSSYRYLTQPGSRLSIFYFETNSHLSLYEPSCHYLKPQKSQHAWPPELLFTVKLCHYLTEVPLIPLSRSFAIWNFFWSPLQLFLANASTPLSEIPEYSIEVTGHLSLQACLQVIFLQHVHLLLEGKPLGIFTARVPPSVISEAFLKPEPQFMFKPYATTY